MIYQKKIRRKYILSRRNPTNTIPRYRYIGYSDDENYEDILKFPKVNDETKKK